jgi:beta-lactamase class A
MRNHANQRQVIRRRRWVALFLSLFIVAILSFLGVDLSTSHSPNGHPEANTPQPSRAAGSPSHGSKGLGGTPATTEPSTTTSPPMSSPFGTSVTGYLAERTGTLTSALYDINTGQLYDLHPGVTQDEASIVKVDILATLLSQQPASAIPTSADEQSLLTSMIEESDNNSATTLWAQAGGPTGIGTFNQRVGMTSTTPSQCVTCPDFPWPGWGLTTTTADDQVDLLRQFVVPNKALSTSQRQYGLGLMENITSSESWGVTGGVPPGVTVALKNGWLPLTGATDWQVNSIGWINGDGRNYILAVLTTGNPTEQYGIDTIDQVSSQVWSELG